MTDENTADHSSSEIGGGNESPTTREIKTPDPLNVDRISKPGDLIHYSFGEDYFSHSFDGLNPHLMSEKEMRDSLPHFELYPEGRSGHDFGKTTRYVILTTVSLALLVLAAPRAISMIARLGVVLGVSSFFGNATLLAVRLAATDTVANAFDDGPGNLLSFGSMDAVVIAISTGANTDQIFEAGKVGGGIEKIVGAFLDSPINIFDFGVRAYSFVDGVNDLKTVAETHRRATITKPGNKP